MILKIHPDNPDDRNIQRVVDCLQDGGIVVYPTDTVYGVGCLFNDSEGIEKIYQMKKRKSILFFAFFEILFFYIRDYPIQFFKVIW